MKLRILTLPTTKYQWVLLQKISLQNNAFASLNVNNDAQAQQVFTLARSQMKLRITTLPTTKGRYSRGFPCRTQCSGFFTSRIIRLVCHYVHRLQTILIPSSMSRSPKYCSYAASYCLRLDLPVGKSKSKSGGKTCDSSNSATTSTVIRQSNEGS